MQQSDLDELERLEKLEMLEMLDRLEKLKKLKKLEKLQLESAAARQSAGRKDRCPGNGDSYDPEFVAPSEISAHIELVKGMFDIMASTCDMAKAGVNRWSACQEVGGQETRYW